MNDTITDEEEDYDPQRTLEEYGYGRSAGRGKTVAIVLLCLLLAGAGAGAFHLGRLWSEEQARSLELERQLDSFTRRISELENSNSELSSLLADKQAETERMREEWGAQVETLEQQHQEQLQRTYAHMNEIVFDSRKTLSYIGEMEGRLRQGQELDREEAARLTGVIHGLALLHEQYKKPLSEFRELNRYFSQQLSALPSEQADPLETTPPLQRVLRNRKFRQERADFFETQGRRTALVDARSQVETAYASAQSQMAAISLDSDRYLAQLEEIVASNERSAEDVEEFFQTTKEILDIHDRIMSIEPPAAPEATSPTEVRP